LVCGWFFMIRQRFICEMTQAKERCEHKKFMSFLSLGFSVYTESVMIFLFCYFSSFFLFPSFFRYFFWKRNMSSTLLYFWFMIVKSLVCPRGACKQFTMVSVSKIFSSLKSLKYNKFAQNFWLIVLDANMPGSFWTSYVLKF
jgi:hypothetical protein